MNINWSDKYLLGIEEIDKQHKKLIEISEKLNDLIELGNKIDRYDDIIEVFNELKDYTVSHFKYEEILMAAKDYSEIEEHISEHNKFIEFILKYEKDNLQKIDEDQQKVLSDLVNFVVTWIIEHILNTDKKYVSIIGDKK